METNKDISMKKNLYSIAFAILTVTAVTAADTTTKTTTTKEDGSTQTTIKTTTSTGTVTEYVPGTTFIVKETTGPVTYRYGTKVVYVTSSGKAIPEAELKTRIKVGNPVSVEYVSEGDARVVNRVVIDD
jgi:hypothetical protein